MTCKSYSCFVLMFALASLLTLTAEIEGQVIVNDSWADGGRSNGSDETDASWWTSTSSKEAIEVSAGSLGMVTGGTGRGIHTTFAPQTLAIGDSITVTYKFTTPATVGLKSGGFRVAIFDRLDRGGLADDLTTSSSNPNSLYDALPGYMADFDSNLAEGAKQDITIRKHNLENKNGRLLGTTAGFDALGKGGGDYEFAAAKTQYVGVFSVTRTGEDSADVFSSLSQGENLLTSHTETDKAGIANNFGMVAFHAISGVFGSSSEVGDEDNGIDFSNVVVELKVAPKTDE